MTSVAPGRFVDAWRLAQGTFTTVPVRAPVRVSARTAGTAMLLAPVAGLALGVLAGWVYWTASVLGTGSLVAAVLSIAALRLGDRGFHLDGLADTADGLAASYDRERALAVMRTGDTGPAGATALVLVLLLQVSGAARIGDAVDGAAGSGSASAVAAMGVGGCVMVSRAMLVAGCVRGVPAARPEGLGAVVAGAVGRISGLVMLTLVTAAFAVALAMSGAGVDGARTPWWSAAVVVAVAAGVVGVVLRRCVRRFGGMTGDVLGAVVEVSLATSLVVLAAISVT